MVEPLAPGALRARCSPDSLPFDSTEELEPLALAVGQERAAEALAFGLGLRRKGYNIFVIGRAGVGRHALVDAHLRALVDGESAPEDLAYVSNLRDPRRPRLVRFPSGRAAMVAADFDHAVAEAVVALAAVGGAPDREAVQLAVLPPFEALAEKHRELPPVR
ncbi:MAG: AAA family ATPase, partial [Polyangiaceae bacterium]|nr:AAA family ATPase [Polyangiaceae bacterium]